jgi:proteasome lid subunit RPN8/RPN11
MHVGTIGRCSTPVALGAAAAACIRSASAAARPQEACGLLFGRGGVIEMASVARNVAADPTRFFEIDPAHLFDSHRLARSGAFAILGCWHSHPAGSAVPSAADRDGVTEPGWLWLIESRGEIAAWRPVAEGFQLVALTEPAP